MPYCCEIPKAKDMSAFQHDAGRQRPCVRLHSAYKDTVKGRGSLSSRVKEIRRTQRRVIKARNGAGSPTTRGHSRRRQKILDERDALLFEQSLVRWPSSLEVMECWWRTYTQ